MATKKSQRVAIWVIALALTVGTIGSFAVMSLQYNNEKQDQERLEKAYSDYQAKLEAQTKELSDKYYPVFKEYKDYPKSFDKDSVEKLTTKDLKDGDGKKLAKDDSFTAYYIGWTPDGEVFDSSFDGDTLKQPLDVTPGAVIEGWTEGAEGMKTGGIRLLSIPADKAYGEQGQGEDIPPNTPLKFVMMVIPTPKQIEVPKILLEQQSMSAGQPTPDSNPMPR